MLYQLSYLSKLSCLSSCFVESQRANATKPSVNNLSIRKLTSGQAGARTLDPRIKSPLLYQLSYLSKLSCLSSCFVESQRANATKPSVNNLSIRKLTSGQAGARTLDPRIKSPLLYQLSYLSKLSCLSSCFVESQRANATKPSVNNLSIRKLTSGQAGARTLDPRIKSPLLYQLSYLSKQCVVANSTTDNTIPLCRGGCNTFFKKSRCVIIEKEE
ncbi:hypothetical protein IV68_GL001108 [Weissella halotolerans DSM 20190]|uniref:Uncharacterized protein n=1 Tax=Weissella halotolerans DSM 20190 TaxID=1123500 RepID=A0A0R2G1E9_9LACO|nr:hypothetical protein IV68_GL001108 [Weissella halotolerans DSM 20190]